MNKKQRWRLGVVGVLLLIGVFGQTDLFDPVNLDLRLEAYQGNYIQEGEILLSKVHRDEWDARSVSYHGPLSTVFPAIAFNRLKPKFLPAIMVGLLGAWLLAFIALAWTLGGSAGALISLVSLLVFMPKFDLGQATHFPFSILMMTVLTTLTLRAEKPGVGNSTFAAVALGVSYMFRSTLAFLPLFIAAWELWSGRKTPIKKRWKPIAILVLGPYLLLLPWIALNASLHKTFMPFEHPENPGRNMIEGALGVVEAKGPNLRGDHSKLFENYPAPGESAFAFAVKTVLRHPIRYSVSYFKRIGFLLGQRPWIFLLALGVFYWRWDEPAFQIVGASIAYYLLIHSFMSVLSFYLIQLWPVLVAAIASSLGPFIFKAESRQNSLRVPAALIVSVLVMWSPFVLSSWSATMSYPRTTSPLNSVIADHPNNAWLLAERARNEFTVNDANRALQLRPDIPGYALLVQQMVSRKGWPEVLFGFRGKYEMGTPGMGPAGFSAMRAEAALRLGRDSKAQAILVQAFEQWKPGISQDDDGESFVRSAEKRLFKNRSKQDILRFSRAVFKIKPKDKWLPQHHLNLRHEIAIEAQHRGDFALSQKLFTELIKENPNSPAFQTDLAISEFRLNLVYQAISRLGRVLQTKPNFLPATLTLGNLLTFQGNKTAAKKVYEMALALPIPPEQSQLRSLIERSLSEL